MRESACVVQPCARCPSWYGSPHARTLYDSCLRGKLQLVPEGKLRKQLEADFGQMVGAGTFYAAPPKVDEILRRLSEMQSAVNKTYPTRTR